MITLHQGSILDATTDYIVNPANSFLNHAGGLAKVIADAASRPYDALRDSEHVPGFWPETAILIQNAGKHATKVAAWERDHELSPLIATGNAHMTSAGVLPYKGIIHAVGPIWNGGTYCERDLLELAYESALIAVPTACDSVALPAISSGIFGFPIDEVARIGMNVAGWFPDYDIEFWLFSDEHMEAFKAWL